MNKLIFTRGNTMKAKLRGALKSKTIWFNAIAAGFAAMESTFSLLQPIVSGNVFIYITVVVTVGNAILRTITSQSLADK
jgi:hypothetical protein